LVVPSSTSRALRAMQKKKILHSHQFQTLKQSLPIMMNRTRLYFEQINIRNGCVILQIFERASQHYCCRWWGQIANNLGPAFSKNVVMLLWEPLAKAILIKLKTAEKILGLILNQLGVDQPPWQRALSLKGGETICRKEVGLPCISPGLHTSCLGSAMKCCL